MGLSWKIEKKDISLEDYNKAFEIGSHTEDENKPREQTSKYERAYEEASKVRQFEIQMYWERTKYFWAFISTIYVAYYKVFVDIYEKEHGVLPLLVLACLGFIFSVAWILVNKGSKHWQENWENHIDLLEDSVTGPLHKIYKHNASYSVSKVNLHLSYVVCCCSFCLVVWEMIVFCKKLKSLPGILFYLCFVLFIAAGTVAFVLNAKGNDRVDGEIQFDKKKYEERENT
jgi:hypothetical protein